MYGKVRGFFLKKSHHIYQPFAKIGQNLNQKNISEKTMLVPETENPNHILRGDKLIIWGGLIVNHYLGLSATLPLSCVLWQTELKGEVSFSYCFCINSKMCIAYAFSKSQYKECTFTSSPVKHKRLQQTVTFSITLHQTQKTGPSHCFPRSYR